MSVQTTEQKKEEFRKYLEKAGVIDQLTKVLVGLYEEPEKPGNVIDFIKKSLGAPSDTDVEQLMAENEELKRQKNDLEKKIETLTVELEQERAKQWTRTVPTAQPLWTKTPGIFLKCNYISDSLDVPPL